MPSVTFRNATKEVAPLAAPLIEEHFKHLLKHNVRIEYVFRSKTSIKNGTSVWGVCRKISSLNAFLSAREETADEKKQEPFFVIDLSEPVWKMLKSNHREALLHHELSHAGAEYDDKSNTKLYIIPHDLEEFAATYAKYGAWSQAIRKFLDAANPKLDFEPHQDAGCEPAPTQNEPRFTPLPGVQYPSLAPFGSFPGIAGADSVAGILPTGTLLIESANPAPSDVLEAEYTEVPQEKLPQSTLTGDLMEELRTSKKRIGEIAVGGLPSVPNGEDAQVIRLQGSRYVVVSIKEATIECRHVVHSSEWQGERLPYADLSQKSAPCCIGMQLTCTDNQRWVIDSDVVYQVLPLERKAS